ncbi:MAG: VapE family protein [Proteobacteria bacterium]|nr:VapE family protein [Pseudomonadota bacterium]MDA0855709.1 VapE family protein [Pseudomonadota bacterium]
MEHPVTPPDLNSLRHKAQLMLPNACESLVTIGSNVYFRGSDKARFKNHELASLEWIYSVIQSGKLLEEDTSDAAEQKDISLVSQFKQLADLAEKVEAAKKARDGLGKPMGASKDENKQTEAIQQYNQLKKSYEESKKHLPVFCWSGTFKPGQPPRNENLVEHSGRLQIDIDGLGTERAREVRDLLAKDAHIEVAFLSPSRLGVKAAMLIPPCKNDREHKQAFLASKNYIEKTYSLTIDESCKDVRRVCFLSYDPDLSFNNNATPLDICRWSNLGEPEQSTIFGGETELISQLPAEIPNTVLQVDAEQYLKDGLHQIVTATEGGRHKTYSRIAYTCGGLVSAGALDREETLKKLVEAARDVRQENPAAAERTVRECFAEGEKKPCTPTKGNWHYLKKRDGETPRRKPNLHNVVEWLTVNHMPIWYDEFHQRTMTINEKSRHVEWDDELTLKLTKKLQNLDDGWRDISDTLVDKAVQTYAYEDKRNELTDHLDSLQWDGVPRLDTWLIDYCNTEDNLYAHEAGKCWLLAAAARAYVPGTKFDHCLILQGKQGYFKSTVFSTLGGNWFCELQEFKGKDAQEKLLGKWIIEFGELSVLKKADNETIKSFITERADRFRPAYARRAKDFPRTCVFGGSTNEDEFLSDATGNRRFWPIRVPSPIRIDELKRARDQLLAEAVHRYKNGEAYLMSKDAQRIAEQEQEQALSSDPWEESVRSYIVSKLEKDILTVNELIEYLQADNENRFQITSYHKIRIGKILQTLGWERSRNSVKDEAGKRPWVYKPGANAKVVPKIKGSEKEAKSTGSFLIDNPCPEKPPLSNEHLRKLREQGPQLQGELIKAAEELLKKSNEISFEDLENLLDNMLSKLIKIGITVEESWVAIEKDTGNWKEAFLRRESYPTAYQALAKLLSKKLALQHS